jgi:uncharacterized protein (UPF0548 family)
MRLARAGQIHRLLPRYSQLRPTYEHVGATQSTLPTGFHITRRRIRLGVGDEVFDRASRALLTWDMHRRCGFAVASTGPVDQERTVLLGLGAVVVLVIPCRVIYVVEESRRRGFGYGTLPDHPEQGEEAFVVTLSEDGTVFFDITAFSRPGNVVVRALGPVARLAQSVATTRYQRALRSLVGTER